MNISNWFYTITMQAKTITQTHFWQNTMYNGEMHAGGRPTTRKRNPLGERIARARERAGFSQYDLAEKIGVTQSTVVGWERKVNNLRSDTLVKLATALNISADELLGLSPPEEPKLTGRVRDLFEQLINLPRRQKEKALETIEDTLEGQRRRELRKTS